ncbi:acyltransferase family protein [Lacisediminihabitans sp.]|uniref:acyltransferase family protein n=1 Tax=Lacisediminihabitans sp. TaxID=2787631 RepID=UPI00374CFFEF
MSAPASPRLSSLDGLRGASAAVVVMHHALLTVPQLAQPYYSEEPVSGSIARLLVYTPLHLAWAGTEAVYLFFVLSGIVLALPALRNGFSWAAYFPSRLLRLYLPVIAAVILAAALIALVPRSGNDPSAWLQSRPRGFTPTTLVQDMLLLSGVSRTVSPLWSLQWEVLFSLLLPAYLFAAQRLRFTMQLAAGLALTLLGFMLQLPVLMYLPMFAIGTALGSRWDLVDAAASRWSARRFANAMWAAAMMGGLLLTIGYWLVLPVTHGSWLRSVAGPVALLGVTLVILSAAFWRPAKWVLTRAPFLWLGRVSFALYLIHEPIIIAGAFFFHDARWSIAVSIPVAIAASWLFYRFVERHAHNLARKVQLSLNPPVRFVEWCFFDVV